MEEHNATWPGWDVVRVIGSGSFGTVYEIERQVFDEVEKAALKVISIPQNRGDIEEMINDGYDDESITSTFQAHLKNIVGEYSLMRKMNGCTNVVNCDDVKYIQHEDGIGWDIYIKMELLTPLPKALPGAIDEGTVVKVAKDMCAALMLCKKHNIVHRDIKPQNIFVSDNGDFKLGDFGIAKAVEKTAGGTKTGTYKYMAPEVYNNQPYGTSADIYSLGLVLYWLLNERRMPFMPMPPEKLTAGADELARRRRFSGEEIPAPANGSEALKAIVLKACAFDPKQRYASAAQMLEELNRLDSGAVFIPPVILPAASAENPAEPLQPGDATVNIFSGKPKRAEAPLAQAELAEEKTEYIPQEKREYIPPQQQKTEEPKKKNRWLLPAILSVAVIILALLLLLKGCDGEEKENTTSPTHATTTQASKKVESITVNSAPAKIEYFVGETLDTTGLILSVSYSDGTSTLVADGFTCDAAALDTVGACEIVVTYMGITTSFTVEVKEPSVVQIQISKIPTKVQYNIGDAVDTSGMELTVSYDNGKEAVVTEGFTCEPEVCTKAGKQTITVSFGGKTAEYDVEVADVTLTGISIKSEPSKLEYYEGDSLDMEGLTLLATYSNGETKTITGGFTCDPKKLKTEGEQTVTVKYGKYSAKFKVKVKKLEVASISIEKLPKTEYYTGDTLDTAGLVLTVYYNSGETKSVDSGFTCSPTALNSEGTQMIVVTYGGKTTTFTVTVTESAISSIEIKTMPTKTQYYTGDTLYTTGMVLRVKYNNGTTETITTGYTCSPTVLNTAGTQTVTVYYGGKTATFTVSVTQTVISSIAVKSKPTKTQYYVGDTLDTAGLVLNVHYNNGTTQTVTSGFTCNPTALSAAGTNMITVYYEGKTTYFYVSVEAVCMTGISVCTEPNKTSYYIGDGFVADGLSLMVYYNNGQWTIVYDGFTVNAPSFTEAGTVTVTITYEGFTTYTNVKVIDFFGKLSGSGSAGYSGQTAVYVQYYDGAYYYVVPYDDEYDALYKRNSLGGSETCLYVGRGISDLCVIDGYIFFCEQLPSNEYFIGALDIANNAYWEVINDGNNYWCYYLDGWIYTRSGDNIVRLKPGRPDSLEVLCSGWLLAMDNTSNCLWFKDDETLKKYNIGKGTVTTVSAFSNTSFDQAYAIDGDLYIKAYTSTDGTCIYRIRGSSVTKMADYGESFTIWNDLIICTREGDFYFTDLSGNDCGLMGSGDCCLASTIDGTHTRVIGVNADCFAYIGATGRLHVWDSKNGKMYHW